MRILTTLILFLSTVTLCYSQDSYPKKIVYEGDTLVAITISQAKEINKTFLSENYYKTVFDSLQKKVVLLNMKLQNDSLIQENLGINIFNLELIQDNAIAENIRLARDLELTDRQLRKVQIRSKYQTAGLGVLAVVVVILLIISK